MGAKEVKRRDAIYRTHYAPHLNPGTLSTGVDQIKLMLERMLIELSMNRFEWKGLPGEIDIRWLELNLLENALSVFYFDDEYDRYFAMRGSGSGPVNMIGNPTEFLVYGNEFYTKTMKAEDVVPIWANYTRIPDWDIIRIYANRIAEMDRTIEINAVSARRTKVLTYPENMKLSVENLNNQLNRGVGAVKIPTSLRMNEIFQALDLGSDPDTIVNMHILRSREWNEVMTLLGINNANQDKKERLVAAEVSGNDDMVAALRATNLQARQFACKQINKKYNLNVSVDYVTNSVDVGTAELKQTNQLTAGGESK